MEERRRSVEYIDIGLLDPSNWNPNMQTESVFNALTENIREIGMTEPLMVSPRGDGRYLIVSGQHRWEACKVLGYEQIPVYVMDEFDDDKAKFQTVRMNVLKGKLDPVKFTKLYEEMALKYGGDITKQMMGMLDEKEFQKLYVNVKKELPKELQKKLQDAKGEIKNVDDLSRILNEMFSKYGDTLKNNYMVFQYGGKTHVWVMMSNKLKVTLVDHLLEEIHAGNYDLSEFFLQLITKHGDEVLAGLTPFSAVAENEFDGLDGEPVDEEE